MEKAPEVAAVENVATATPLPATETVTPSVEEPKAGEVRLYHGDRGGSYKTLFAEHLRGSKKITVEDPYIRLPHQVVNFLRFCELAVELGTVEEISLTTSFESEYEKQELMGKLTTIEHSLSQHGIVLKIKFSETLHDRAIRSDNGWSILLGRGLD